MVLPEELLSSKKETDEIFIQRAGKADNICLIYLKTEVGDNKEKGGNKSEDRRVNNVKNTTLCR